MKRAVWLLALVACGGEASVPQVAQRPPEPKRVSTAGPVDAAVSEDAAAPASEADAATDVVSSEPPKPRIGSVSHYMWVYKNASRQQQPIGYVRPGTSVELQDTEPVAGTGCQSGKWMRIVPTGFVCLDGAATLDLESPLYRALSTVVKPRDHVLPYRYAYSTGAPMYGRVPNEEEMKKAERGFHPVDKLLPPTGTTYEELAAEEVLRGTDAIPAFATPGSELPRMRGHGEGLVRKTIPSGSLLSFSHAFEVRGRTYLLSTDLTLVTSDRVRPFRETRFRGVALDGSIPLPIAWTKGAPRKKYRKLSDGGFEQTGDTWAPRTMLRLTGVRETHKVWVYLETRESGMYVRERDASVVDRLAKLPSTIKASDKWIEFSAGRGTFTLYVGRDPVYSTLASPGRGGGAPRGGMSEKELVEGSYTPLGIYRVTFKTMSTTMTPEGVPNPQKHWVQDVPYTQYFQRPFAIHTAYWHEDFGEPKSGGCINLSPEDARFVFGWTEPRLPEDWSGVSSSQEMGLGTPVIIRR